VIGPDALHPPDFIAPCLPTISRTAPTGVGWAYAIKPNGFRFICRRDGVRESAQSWRELLLDLKRRGRSGAMLLGPPHLLLRV